MHKGSDEISKGLGEAEHPAHRRNPRQWSSASRRTVCLAGATRRFSGYVSLLLIFAVASAISPPEVAPEVEAAPTEPAPIESTTASEQPVPPPAGPPGGYRTLAEAREYEVEPHDGDDELTIGSVLLSLGLIRAGAGVISVWMASNPEQCPLTGPGACSGLRNYGWVGVAEGGLMIGTGITYLAIGAVRRQRHQRWERGEPLSLLRSSPALDVVDVGPWLIPRTMTWATDVPGLSGAGLRLRLQF